MASEVNENDDEVLAQAYDTDVDKLPTFTRNKYKLVGEVLATLLSRRDATVVELGCGNSELAKRLILPKLSGGPKYIGVDKNPLLKHRPDVTANITSTPLSNESADAVLCLDVLEHLDPTELDQAISEITRIVKTDAPIIITVPSMYNLDRFNPGAIKRGTHKIKLPPQKWMMHLGKYIKIERVNGIGIGETLISLPQFLKLLAPESDGIEAIVNRLYWTLRRLEPGRFDPFLYELGAHQLPVLKEYCSSIMFIGKKKES